MHYRDQTNRLVMRKQILNTAIATLLWLISTVLGGITMFYVFEATRLIVTILIPVDPDWTVAHGPQVIFVSRVILFILAISLIAFSILLLEKYHDAAAEPRRLGRWFAVTTIIELTVLGLAATIFYVISDQILGIM
jgi:hypothetical protein